MKRIVLIAAAALLLTGCQSKKEICAKWSADEISTTQAKKKLGITGSDRGFSGNNKVYDYCMYYRD
jgi:PBP1b-binding outer membrane lipoprotein LpoB